MAFASGVGFFGYEGHRPQAKNLTWSPCTGPGSELKMGPNFGSTTTIAWPCLGFFFFLHYNRYELIQLNT